jgi:hypothetical protein
MVAVSRTPEGTLLLDELDAVFRDRSDKYALVVRHVPADQSDRPGGDPVVGAIGCARGQGLRLIGGEFREWPSEPRGGDKWP